jgi:hypothetical protein
MRPSLSLCALLALLLSLALGIDAARQPPVVVPPRLTRPRHDPMPEMWDIVYVVRHPFWAKGKDPGFYAELETRCGTGRGPAGDTGAWVIVWDTGLSVCTDHPELAPPHCVVVEVMPGRQPGLWALRDALDRHVAGKGH